MSASAADRGVPQSLSDYASILEGPILVPRENKLLARKTIADRATSPEDCRELLAALGVLDLNTLPEPGGKGD